jgi:hypothetical protein
MAALYGTIACLSIIPASMADMPQLPCVMVLCDTSLPSYLADLQGECKVHDMASTTDYRKLAQHQRGLYFCDPATR